MPQLKSGRHVALGASPYLDALNSDKQESRYFAIVALRIHAGTPQSLRDHLVIGYFVEGEGTPPDAPAYNSGYCVADVLEGRTDWSAEEVAEFREFLAEERCALWLQAEFEAIHAAIRDNAVWDSELLENDLDSDEIDVPMLKRAVIQRSALAPDAMAQLRGGRVSPLPEIPIEAADDVPGEPQPPARPPAMPDALREFILAMARREDIHSVSCQFKDAKLWEGLLTEQVRRARQTGKAPRQAYFLCGPDSAMPGIAKHHHGLEDLPPEEWFDGSTLEEQIGGDIHIPCEGVCGADLFVYPAWRRINPKAWEREGAELDWATTRKSCNHLLIEQDLGEPSCATRTGPIAGTWWLYSSKAPYKDCNPFRTDD